MAEVHWFRTPTTLTAIATILYLGALALLLHLLNPGPAGLYAFAAASALALLRIASLPWAAGVSEEGLHVRTLLRPHRLIPWALIAKVEAAPGVVRVSTRAGRSLRLPDARGALAREIEGRQAPGGGVRA